MDKVDLKKEFKHLYGAKARPEIVDVPELNFLMVDGKGAPEGTEFQQAMQLLYGAAYTIKFDLKKAKVGPEYSVMALEGLWWASKGEVYEIGERQDWVWTVMILQPGHIKLEHLEAAKLKIMKKDPSLDVSKLRLDTFQEGRCVQMLHVGPYSTEPATVKVMHVFMERNGLKQRGKHHEIYLSDPKRTVLSKLKTILRHPVE
ncbi:MAG: hypothetical protein A4E32_01671 [Methanomassiliicoccales archaeon PtaU1.Bin124]|nr:MAG: hypothetical protein A4E32_01671 [Methanomassiliicoccales archaeon PtaU1.Bin124]